MNLLYEICVLHETKACEQALKWGIGRRQKWRSKVWGGGGGGKEKEREVACGHSFDAAVSPSSPIFLFSLHPNWEPYHRL